MEGDVPLVTSFGGNEIEFGANGTKVLRSGSRMSTLLFWQGRGKGANGTQNKNWIHAPDTLIKGHVVYLVKFLGNIEVEEPKGIEVVKDAIKKLQFAHQLKKSEAKDAAKCKKVEITISVDGVAVQEPRTNIILHQFPLHRISYCADDKGAKKYFSFIAKSNGKTQNGKVNSERNEIHNDGSLADEKNECFVFISTKLASDITLTIGQAFELAYRRFLTENGKYLEVQKLSLLNKKLELQMNAYKTRLQELSKITYKDDLSSYLSKNNLKEITHFETPLELQKQIATLCIVNEMNGDNGGKNLDKSNKKKSNHDSGSEIANPPFMSDSSPDNDLLLSTPPQHNGRTNKSKNLNLMNDAKNPAVGTKLEGLLLNSDSDSDFDPRAFEADSSPRVAFVPSPAPRANTPATATHTHTHTPLIAPPPKSAKRQPLQSPPSSVSVATPPPLKGSDLFGSPPFSQPPAPQAKPNYDITDFNLQTSVFTNSNITNGLTGYDPFDTQKTGNIFANGFANNFNGFGNLSEKPTVELDSGFNGFLDKTISEMKDGFSRGIAFGNEDFSIDNLDPLKKN